MIGPLAYIGGKNRLAKQIIQLLPEHTTYVEAFAGGAQVFFHKEPSKVEVLNDLDGELINFLKVCQWHHEELIRFMQYLVVSRAWFQIFSQMDPATMTDVQRAVRFLYLQKNCFGGLILKQHYHYGVIQRPNYNPKRIPEVIRAAHQRLQQVQIESLPYQEVLQRYDRPTTLFYLDPPYWRRKLYKFNFTDDDFRLLEQRLHGIKGRFILSLDDHPEVRKLFGNWHLVPVEIMYTAQMKSGRRYGELLITNFKLQQHESQQTFHTKEEAG
jgi:DNA adenine methylase